jgi:polyphenol oxidase
VIRWEGAGAYTVVFSTRVGGVSEGVYASLNLGLSTGDERARVEENRRRLFAAAGVPAERVSWARQVHGARVIHARSGDVCISEIQTHPPVADGLWTDERRRALLAVTADCLPVALARVDGERPAVALLHVGWRGLVAGVVAAGRAALGGRLVAAAIGPGIGGCCYEVGEDVAGPVRAGFGLGLVRDGRLDLPGAVERALRAAGVGRVDRLDVCTACDEDRFFSNRRDRGLTGRQGALAFIR